ncbi:M23 family metallopeptidase [Aquimarina algiphila]|uniref:M23 family metallopeptidase n=1 Tax=Aquimarina algiphila TaxID=2047982 RepID=UPI00232BDA00|nr:M23 family metallopeptidase [Aquimarina algiphila]
MKNSKVLYMILLGFILLIPKAVSAQKINRLKNKNSLPIYFPLDKNDFEKVSSPYGYRKHPISKKTKLHKGIDLVAKKGKPVYATATGIVQKVNHENGYGNRILIMHLAETKTLYGHLWITMVRKGEHVRRGQLIGFVGDTGRVTGPHLHYEIWVKNKKIDPVLVWKNMIKPIQEKIAIN